MLPELYSLDIKQIVSTWLELMELMSAGHFFIVSVRGNISMGFWLFFRKESVRGNISTLYYRKTTYKCPFARNSVETSENCSPQGNFHEVQND